MSIPPTKTELLAAIRESRAELEELVAALSLQEMEDPGVQGEWSVKDMLAHIAAWERLAEDRIRAAQSGSEPNFPPIKDEDAVDAFNAEVYARYNDDPLDAVLTEFHEAHADLMAQIEALDEETLQQKLPFEWAGNLTYQVLISANTHWHYPEHSEALAAWLEAQRG